MYNPLSICKIILRTHSRNSSLVCWLCTQNEDTLHPCYIWDAILVSTSVGQLLRKHLVINLGIDYLPAGFDFKQKWKITYPPCTFHSKNRQDPYGLGIEISIFNDFTQMIGISSK
jgi:hypothetical protein